MPLPAPILDDRSYQQLRDELVRRIPVYAPEWTDHNASDPGITLIELFAFLGENLLYRFNQIPDATKLAFLRMLQLPLRPAAAARALITLARTDTAGTSVLIPIGTQVAAGSVPFQTLTEVSAWPLEITAIGKIVTQAPQTQDAQEFANAAIDARGGIQQGEQAAYYLNQTVPGDPTAAGAMPVDFETAAGPVDFQKSVDGTIWIAVRKTKSTDVNQLGAALLSIGFIPDLEVPSIDEVDACPGLAPADNGSQLVWEASTGALDSNGKPTYLTLKLEGDTTLSLAQQGTLQVRLPKDITTLGVYTLTDPDLQGTDAFPPQIEDAQLAADVLFWLRVSRSDPARPLGKVLFIGINATEVVQSIKAQPEFLGTGNAQADQTFTLVHKPVLQGTARIQVEESGAWTDWQAVDGFEESTEDSRHYVLDLEAGSVRFGNGVRGRAPQIGERIRALEYSYGGGIAGNVGAKAISKVADIGTVKASNPLPASGGAESESIAAALERVPGEFRRHDRAVTQSDFQELALATPGANVGRADCIPLFDPKTKSQDAAGVVSVVVWPAEDLKHPNAPAPDRALLRQVCAWLDARRLVTTELYVIPPTYKQIAVSVGVQAKPGYGIEAVRRWVELVIRQYLAPLPPYGPDGGGWPLGRAVYGPELEAAALQVEGVLYVECLRIAQWDATTNQWAEASADSTGADGCLPRERIDLQPWEVPEVVEMTVVQGPALKPGDAVGAVTPPLVPIPIPTIPDEC
ncbi:MAG TPA: putative baseplate assembly protein [Burkholderiales bacterium]|nr:putative baseplate assembly protein [Burkholderiales bacterium]